MGEIMKQQLFSLILTHGWCGEATRWGIPPLSMSAAGRLNIKAARSNVLLMDASHVKGNQINQSVKTSPVVCISVILYKRTRYSFYWFKTDTITGGTIASVNVLSKIYISKIKLQPSKNKRTSQKVDLFCGLDGAVEAKQSSGDCLAGGLTVGETHPA